MDSNNLGPSKITALGKSKKGRLGLHDADGDAVCLDFTDPKSRRRSFVPEEWASGISAFLIVRFFLCCVFDRKDRLEGIQSAGDPPSTLGATLGPSWGHLGPILGSS